MPVLFLRYPMQPNYIVLKDQASYVIFHIENHIQHHSKFIFIQPNF